MALNDNRLDVAERLLKPHLKDDPVRRRARSACWPSLRRASGALAGRRAPAPPRGRARARLHRRAGQSRAGPRADGPTGRSARAARRLLRGRARRHRPLEPQGRDARPARRFRRGDRALRAGARARAEPAAGVAELRPYAQDRRPAGGGDRAPIARRSRSTRRWARRGGAWPTSRRSIRRADIAAMEAALATTGLERRGPLPSRFRAGQGDARRRPGRRGVRAIMPSGNALRRKSQPYHRAAADARRSTAASRCSPPKRSPSGAGGCAAPDPIFIVGMPRAGSTLVEQILSSATAWSRERRNCPTCRRCRAQVGDYPRGRARR